MYPFRVFPAFLLILMSCKNETSPAVIEYDAPKKEVSAFLGHYGNLVRKSKFDSLYTLYEKQGAVRAGIGFLEKQNLDTIKAEYARFDMKTRFFEWVNPQIDMLSPNTALVTSRFNWLSEMIPDTAKSTYSGIFRKSSNKWQIMYEHESWDLSTVKKLAEIYDNKKDSTGTNN